MYYICLEDSRIVSIMPYEPNVPSSVEVFEITDQQYSGMEAKTCYFDIATKLIVEYGQEHLDAAATKKEQEQANAEQRLFLESTDWQVLRHLRQKALGQPTTLTEQEYLDLEQARADAAAAIVQIQ